MKKISTLCFLTLFCFVAKAQNRPQVSENKPITMQTLAEYEKRNPPVYRILRESDDWEEIDRSKNKIPANSPNRRVFTSTARTEEQSRLNSPLPNTDFNALDDNNAVIPPDIHGCAGANHLMVTLNSEYRIMSKSGTVTSTVSASGFWTGVTPAGHTDPHVHYDHITNRWIIVAQSTTAATSALLVAVSQTNDPTGTWNRYAIDVDATNTIWIDFPLVGYNQNWLTVAGNMFNVSGNAFAGKVDIFVLDMAALNAGTAITVGTNAQIITTTTNDGSFSLSPCTNYDGTNEMYLLEEWNGTAGALRQTNLTGTLPSVVWSGASATFPINGSLTWQFVPNPSGDFSPQLGESRKISVNDARMNNVVLRNGKLWAAHHILLPGSGTTTRGAIQWWVITAATSTPVQIGTIDDGTGSITRAFPSIAVDAAENVVIGYSIFSSTIYASAAYSYRQSCTAANTMQNEIIYKKGLSSYFKNFGGSRDRWGDYSNACLDPTTGRFWVLEEYAGQRVGASDNDSRWGSWWAEVAPQPTNAVFFSNSVIGTIPETNSAVTGCRKYKDYTISVGVACAATGNATVTLSTTGSTAVAGQDFDLIPSFVSYTNGDNALKNVTLRVYDDDAVESNETIVLGYSISGAGVISGTGGQSQIINVTDNDFAPIAIPSVYSLGANNVAGGFNLPFRGAFEDARMQFIYKASELLAAGVKSGSITDITLNVLTKASTGAFNGLNIKMKNTTNLGLTTNGFETGAIAFYSGNYATVSGLNTFHFTASPFIWDGTSNLLIEICYDNAATVVVGVDNVAATSTTASEDIWNRLNGTTGCTIVPAFNSVAGPGFLKPDIRLTFAGDIIASNLITTNIYLGPNADISVYNASGEIQARIKNNTGWDYGCTQVKIDRAGTATTAFWNNTTINRLLDKTFQVIPSNPNASGSYDVTLYYTSTEVGNWQTATPPNTWLGNAKIVKIKEPNRIADVTPSSPPSITTNIEVNLPSTPSVFGSNYSITATFGTGFSGFGVGNPGTATLPVSMLSFQGQKNNNVVDLTWQVAFENNNNRFEVETGKEANNFYKIGAVNSRGNSSSIQSYTYTDNMPARGVNYYRLRQVDNDGVFSYSRTIAVTFDAKGKSITVYPNPAKDKLTIAFAQPQQNVSLRIISTEGKEIMKETAGGIQRNYDISVSKLIPGSYILEVRIGKEKNAIQFVKE